MDIIEADNVLEVITGLGSILLSCIDADAVHVVFLPREFPRQVAVKSSERCSRLKVFYYETDEENAVARMMALLVGGPGELSKKLNNSNIERLALEALLGGRGLRESLISPPDAGRWVYPELL